MAVTVRLPRLLNADGTERARLRPTALSLQLQLVSVSSAQMTLTEQDAPVAMHDLVELYTAAGSAGLYRVTSIQHTYTRERVITLLQGIDALSDSVWNAQEDYTGTVRDYLSKLLAKQKTTRWQLGTCQDSGAWKRAGLNYDRLSDLYSELMGDRDAYYPAYNFSTNPWTLQMLALPAAPTSEFRLSRNVRSCQVTRSDAEQCTRLYLSVSTTTENPVTGYTVQDLDGRTPEAGDAGDTIKTTDTHVTVYNNTAAQQIYGIIEKTADIDAEDVPDPAAWASKFLQDRAEPTVQITIDGDELAALTGETWDALSLGRLCRVALAEYGETYNERAVAISYPDVLGEPTRVTVELANRLPKFSNAISSVKSTAASANATAKKASRGSGSASKDLEHWAIVTKKSKEAQDGTGLTQLYESGITVDAEDGVHIYSLGQGFQSEYAGIKVNRNAITAEVRRSTEAEGLLSSRITQTADAITAEVSRATAAEDEAYSRIRQTADSITAEVARATASEGNLSTRITQTADSITSLAQKSGVAGLQEGETLFSRITQNAESITSEVGRATAAEETIGSRITQTEDSITAEVTRATAAEGALSARITVNAEGITSKVSKGDISSTINQTAQGVQIAAGKIDLSGYTSLQTFNAAMSGYAQTFTTVDLYPTNTYTGLLSATNLYVGNQGSPTQATWQTKQVVTGGRKSGQQAFALSSNGSSITGTMYATMVTDLYTDTIYYLGRS